MPLLSPISIDRALQEAGISKPKTVREALDAAGLAIPDVVERLELIVSNSDSDSTKLRAIESILKMHGALEDSSKQTQSLTIVIQDSDVSFDVNPILLPR